MHWLRKKRVWLLAVLLIGAPFLINTLQGLNQTALTTTPVTRGAVERAISVSGFLEADQLVDMSFPSPGRLSALYVSEGDEVQSGELLATVGNGALAAERSRALAGLVQAEAAREELLNGLTLEAAAVSSTTVEQARNALLTTRESEERKIAQAYSRLLSNDLEAQAIDPEEDVPAPVVAGSYRCDTEGTYDLTIYPSAADSGYSVRYDGLETGVAAVSTVQPVPIGTCGLELVFPTFTTYNPSEWKIRIPNELSETYVQQLRAYELVQEQAKQNISAAEYALELAEANATEATSAPRVESVLSANAAVISAQADVARIDALLADESIFAPFSGIVTNISSNVGETVSGSVLSVVANDTFTLIAQVPEIDIREVQPGMKATVDFDAAAGETLSATIDFVSPIATVIDGVSYYEIRLSLPETPDWFRDGLNADVDIITEELTDTLRVALRYIFDDGEGKAVLLQKGDEVATTSIDVVLEGTDGFAAITGLTEGDTVIAPQ